MANFWIGDKYCLRAGLLKKKKNIPKKTDFFPPSSIPKMLHTSQSSEFIRYVRKAFSLHLRLKKINKKTHLQSEGSF